MFVSIRKSISDFLEFNKVTIRRNMISADVNATGYTSASIEDVPRDLSGELLADENLIDRERGTPPKSKGGGITEVEAERWVSVRSLDISPFAIAANINKKGTQTFQEGGRTDIYTEAINDDQIEDVFLDSSEAEAVKSFFDEYIYTLDK